MARSKRYPPDVITAEQCRAARAWLMWTQAELGYLSYLGTSTIKEFEAGLRQPHASSLAQLQRTFENAGVKFLGDGPQRGLAVSPTEHYQNTLILTRRGKIENAERQRLRVPVQVIERLEPERGRRRRSTTPRTK
jgi:hypothetical protein